MRYGYREYTAIKFLLEKYGIIFKDYSEYDRYIRDLVAILKI